MRLTRRVNEVRMKLVLIIVGSLGLLGLLGWLGLRLPPRSLPQAPLNPGEVSWTALPDDLPAPVARFYQELYGDELPVIDSAVVSGRGTMRVGGLTAPVRFRFTHATGADYRHHIEVMFFGLRVLTVHETFLDGAARLELPFGVSEGSQVDQGANLALWAEAVWMPSVWVTDPRVRWEAIDEHSALLVAPFGDREETFIARFDPDTGLLRLLESMRFKGADDELTTLWLNEVVTWVELDGWLLPRETALTWFDDGTPWARMTTEEVRYNADVRDYLRQRGP